MRAGALRNVITIQSQSSAGNDALNAPIVTWGTFRDVFCEMTPRRGGEKYDETTGQRYSESMFWFRCRYSDVDGVDNTMRIVHEGQTFDIRNLMPDEQRRGDCIIEATLQDGQV